ncbi:MAG TPA: hypothetical protein VFO55_09755 [Gemmatimonadaceae bacterium]|nr:hypothetical protein [Gemmatimonadaceae bacterium]
MHTSMAVFAERAIQRGDGKLDVIGVHNCRFVQEVPSKLELTLALRFELDPMDYGAPQVIAVHIVDDDEKELASLRTNTVTFDQPTEAGLPRAYDLVVPISIAFPKAGTWIFDVRVNDRSVARAPLQIMLVTAPA